MTADFFKFPPTPHLAVLGNTEIRDDKVLSPEEQAAFLQHELVVEEKIDGANMGISFNSSGEIQVQNRGAYLQTPYNAQWKNLTEWLAPHADQLFDLLQCQYILFGEWCYAKHSVTYNLLPDWFLGFDIFDKERKQFFTPSRRNEMFRSLGIQAVPKLGQGHFTLTELVSMLSTSRVSDNTAEGIYLRYDIGDWLGDRSKLVRPEFIQTISEHWTRKSIKPNRVRW